MDQFHPLAASIQLSQEERIKFHRTNIIFVCGVLTLDRLWLTTCAAS